MAPPCTLPLKLAMSGVISTVMESSCWPGRSVCSISVSRAIALLLVVAVVQMVAPPLGRVGRLPGPVAFHLHVQGEAQEGANQHHGGQGDHALAAVEHDHRLEDRKSTRLNSSHVRISYAV